MPSYLQNASPKKSLDLTAAFHVDPGSDTTTREATIISDRCLTARLFVYNLSVIAVSSNN